MEKRFEGRPAAPGIALGALVSFAPEAATRVASDAPDSEARRAALGARRRARRPPAARRAKPTRKPRRSSASRSRSSRTKCSPSRRSAPSPRGVPRTKRGSMRCTAEAAGYESSQDEYFRARAADIRDISDRVLAHLTGSASGGRRAARRHRGGGRPPAFALPRDRLVARRGIGADRGQHDQSRRDARTLARRFPPSWDWGSTWPSCTATRWSTPSAAC